MPLILFQLPILIEFLLCSSLPKLPYVITSGQPYGEVSDASVKLNDE